VLRRRHLPRWRPTEGSVTLFNPAKVTVSRYRYGRTASLVPGRAWRIVIQPRDLNLRRAGCAATRTSGSAERIGETDPTERWVRAPIRLQRVGQAPGAAAGNPMQSSRQRFLACADPASLQAICRLVERRQHPGLLRPWVGITALPLSADDAASGSVTGCPSCRWRSASPRCSTTRTRTGAL